MSRGGSYFKNEHYCFDEQDDKLPVFVEMLKSRGCYISEDGHVRSKKGVLRSKLMRNGYYMTSGQYENKMYYFMEHRVVWVWNNGPIPAGYVINHKDYNRANNRLENLELMTQKENTEYSRPNFNPKRGENNKNAKFSDRQASAIRALGKICGWNDKQISDLVGCSQVNVCRIRNGKRYPDAIDPETIMSVYPVLVDFTRNKKIGIREELKNYALGLSGECGEINDLIKKAEYHGKPLDPVEIALELGDLLYYLCAICLVLGFDFDEIMLNNNAKLIARYSNGYSIKQSLERIEEKCEGLARNLRDIQ